MKLFKCTHCGHLLYFENKQCGHCGHRLGFDVPHLQLVPLIEEGNDTFTIYGHNNLTTYRYCDNHTYGVCNWLVETGGTSTYCKACSLNRTIPDLSKIEYLNRWKEIEKAKHRLIYALLRMHLPLDSKAGNPGKGLTFDFKADENDNSGEKILTGHDDGLITINIAEADDIEREMARKAMDELYRTVLGHFRHEVGHFYWDRLIDGSHYLDECRQLFGDDRRDYSEALKVHYAQGPPPDWNTSFISAYATTHPWEDWAETWAHYLHIMDTLETAYAFGLSVEPNVVIDTVHIQAQINVDPYRLEDFNRIMAQWLPLTFAMNSLNRSMGLHDSYPFVIMPKVMEKLTFIHKVCFAERKK